MKLRDEVNLLSIRVECMQETIERQKLAIQTLKRILIKNGLIKDANEFMHELFLYETEEKKRQEEFDKFIDSKILEMESTE